METIPYHPLIQVTREDVEKIRKRYNLDVIHIKENINAIEVWCKKQEHLKEAFKHLTRDNIERIHLLANGSVEATKSKIDKILTARGMLPEILLNKTVDEFRHFNDDITFIMLPKLSPICHSRIFVTKIMNDNIQKFNILPYLRYSSLVGEFRLHFEYSMNERHIVDLKNMNINIFTALNPMLMKKAETLCTEVYGAKIKGIHFLNTPPFVDKLVYLLKQCLKEKVASRLHVHNSYEELQKEIPKEIIPEEYGGDGTSCKKINEDWKKYLESENARKIIDISNKLYSDESKRTSPKFNEEYLGMPGSFRRLNVD